MPQDTLEVILMALIGIGAIVLNAMVLIKKKSTWPMFQWGAIIACAYSSGLYVADAFDLVYPPEMGFSEIYVRPLIMFFMGMLMAKAIARLMEKKI